MNPRFGRIHERDGQTDTARRHRPRLHSIARQKQVWHVYGRQEYALATSINFTEGRGVHGEVTEGTPVVHGAQSVSSDKRTN